MVDVAVKIRRQIFLFFNLVKLLKNSTPRKMAYIRQIERVDMELWKDGRLICLAKFSLPSSSSLKLPNRDFKIQRRGRQPECQKNNRFYKENNNFARASRFFFTFLCPRNFAFMGYVNKQRRNFISLSELGYGTWEFNSRRVRLHLTK